MFGISTLKLRRPVDSRVACPVRGCAHQVPAQPGILRLTSEFKCPTHKLFLSETQFAHEKETDALLWTDRESLSLLRASRGERPVLSLGLETSDDALLWNTFRWCQTAGVLPGLLERWTGRSAYDGRMSFWGWDEERERLVDGLRHARSAFQEPDHGGTEPGLMVHTSQHLFILISRGFSAGSTRADSSPQTAAAWGAYESSAQGWADKVLSQSCCDLVAHSGAHEFLRIWLLGTWMAARLEKGLVLVYLTPEGWGEGVLTNVRPRLITGPDSVVAQASWEDLSLYLSQEYPQRPGAPALLSYLKEKSAGYGRDGLLRRAFALGETAPSAADPHLPTQ